MSALVINQLQVRRLLPMADCIELMATTLETLDRGEALNPLRWAMPLPEGLGVLGMMPGSISATSPPLALPAPLPAALGLKIVSVFPKNHGSAYDSHQGVVMLFDTEHGNPIAIVDASEITAIRTAAVSGLATRLLAREDASDLALLGSGVQARTHLEAMLAVRTIRRVRVWSPNPDHRQAFAEAQATRHDTASPSKRPTQRPRQSTGRT